MSSIHAYMGQKISVINDTLGSMLKASDYWQPDKKTSWISNLHTFGLAKAQLYNTENSLKDGVYHDADNCLSITANARIDNRSKLLIQLGIDPDEVSIQTDSQLILQTYVKWGKECVKQLRGDFVFIIWDEAQQKLFCARDHFGVKVLFYSQNKQKIMLSNEHNAFFTSDYCDPSKVDEKWLVENLWNLSPLDFDSPNPDIHILPPAHTLEFDANGIKVKRFWHLERKNNWQNLDDEALIAELKIRFNKAVVARLDSKSPLGAELSEGLDSNGIVGVAAPHLSPEVMHTFSYDCEALSEKNQHIWGDTYKDIEDMLAMHGNLQATWQVSDEKQKEKQTEFDYQAFYQSFGAVIPIQGPFLTAQLAQKKGVQVLLSGWGGDHCVTCPGDEYANELFRHGRGIMLYRLLKGKYERGRGRHPVRSIITTALSQLAPKLNFFLKTRQPCLEKAMQQRGQTHFLHEKWQKHFKLDQNLERFIRQYQRSSVQQYELRELFEIGLTNRLTHTELVARQYRIEYRFPMLDVDLVEFAHSLPSGLKIHKGIERYPFRRLLEGITTPRIQWRRKSDVSHPNIDWGAQILSKNIALLVKLKGNPLSLKYSSDEKIKKYIETNRGGLDNLRFMVDFSSYHTKVSDK